MEVFLLEYRGKVHTSIQVLAGTVWMIWDLHGPYMILIGQKRIIKNHMFSTVPFHKTKTQKRSSGGRSDMREEENVKGKTR